MVNTGMVYIPPFGYDISVVALPTFCMGYTAIYQLRNAYKCYHENEQRTALYTLESQYILNY